MRLMDGLRRTMALVRLVSRGGEAVLVGKVVGRGEDGAVNVES